MTTIKDSTQPGIKLVDGDYVTYDDKLYQVRGNRPQLYLVADDKPSPLTGDCVLCGSTAGHYVPYEARILCDTCHVWAEQQDYQQTLDDMNGRI